MPRALWRGAISFGLVYMPVELHTATRENSLALHMLDSRDFSPVGYQHINKRTGKEVEWAHIVKGYEYKKGDYVALTDADFKHANVKASETIEIDTFCEASEVPTIYFDKPYYLAPGKGGGKVYALLRQVLESTGMVAVATFVMRQRQHLCIVEAQGKILVLQTLRFDDEVLEPADIHVDGKASAAELAMAKTLVKQMAGKFSPAKFKDTYHADLKRRIQEKIKNKETHSLDTQMPEPEERSTGKVIDLMAALKASLGKKSRSVDQRAAPKKAAAAPKKAARGRKRA
jgi:DNA end-binding protein Ku